MSITWTWVITLVMKLIVPMLNIITPVLKTELEGWLKAFYQKALLTENPFDDMLAGFLLEIFDIPKA